MGMSSRSIRLAAFVIPVMIFLSINYLDNTNINSYILSSDSNNTIRSSQTENKTLYYVTTDNKNMSLPSAKTLLDKPPPYDDIDIYKLSPNLTTSPNTIVTAYFRLPSKHGSIQYEQWMSNFLSVQDHMVIFTQPELFIQIKDFRSHALDSTVIILMDMADIPIGNLYPLEFWGDQLSRDYEKDRHQSYQLFWIWLNKIWCAMEAIRHNFFQSDIFLWSDIGCFRDRNYNSKTVVAHREQVPRHEMLCMSFQQPIPPNENFFDDKRKYERNFYHSGSQFAAYADTWKVYYDLFLDTIDQFISHNMLLVDDQVVLQSVCLTNPEMCAYVLSSEVNDKRYHGLRYVLHHGGKYNLWRKS